MSSVPEIKIGVTTPTTQELLLARTLHKSREEQRQEGHLFEHFEKGYNAAMEKLISQRDALLVDATSKPITPEWDRYRQHLKDLPAMAVNIPMPIDLDEDGNLVGVEWPEAPAPTPTPAPSNEEKEK